jgi:hypothetical protein
MRMYELYERKNNIKLIALDYTQQVFIYCPIY